MALRAVLKVIVDAFFFTQTLDEMQVGFVVLSAVVTLGIDRRAELKSIGVRLYAVTLEHLSDDLRDGQVLKDALIGAVREVGQLRNDGHLVAGQAFAGLALGDAIDHPIDTVACRREC